MRVFISYRREDSAPYTGRIYDGLVRRYGKRSVFLDLMAIGAGQDFDQASRQAAASHDVLLAVIGKSWLSCSDDTGRRLDNPDDLLRREITTAMRLGIPVVPVCVGGATMPAERDLPEELRGLCKRNALELSDRHWASDMATLAREIGRLTGTSQVPYRYIAAALILVAVLAGLYLWLGTVGSKALQMAAAELKSGDVAARTSAVRKLDEIARNSDKFYWDAVKLLAAHIRAQAPWAAAPRTGPPALDVQTALNALGHRRKAFHNGEDEPLILDRIDISGANLRATHFESAILWGSNLNDVDLSMARLDHADMGGVSLERANLERADLTEAALWASDAADPKRPSSLRGARLYGARLDGAKLWAADLRDTVGLSSAQLRSAELNPFTKVPEGLQ